MEIPGIAEEDKKIIEELEAQQKAVYDKEAAFNAEIKAEKIDLKQKVEVALKTAHDNRMKLINSDPELKQLYETKKQGIGF